MPIISTGGLEVDDPWHFVADANQVSVQDFTVVQPDSLAAIVDLSDDQQSNKVGVRLTAEDSLDDISAFVSHLGLIELVFPTFKDGRSFSTAVELRRKYGFNGDLRASGDILPDQALYLVRCGFSSVSVPEQFSVEQFKASLSAYSVAYQAAQSDAIPFVIGRRGTSSKAAAE